MMLSLEHELRRGLAELELSLVDDQVGKLLEYLNMIHKWAKTYNLTSVREPAGMMTHHLLDSLAVIAPLRRRLADLPRAQTVEDQAADCPTRVLDVGSGAGLPGVVIAICCPDVVVDCVDAVAKKVAFIRQVAGVLKLTNLGGLHQRVQDLSGTYRVVSSRAFASLTEFARLSSGLLASDGIWLAMKGRVPDDEMAALPGNTRVFHVEQLKVPGLSADRCIVWMHKT